MKKKTCVLCKKRFKPTSRSQGARCRDCISEQQRQRRREQLNPNINPVAFRLATAPWRPGIFDEVPQSANVR